MCMSESRSNGFMCDYPAKLKSKFYTAKNMTGFNTSHVASDSPLLQAEVVSQKSS